MTRKALTGLIAAIAILLAAPAIASAHNPSWGDTHYQARKWAENRCGAPWNWICDGNVNVSVGVNYGSHSRLAYVSWSETYVFYGQRWCNASLRVQQDGGPYVAQVYGSTC